MSTQHTKGPWKVAPDFSIVSEHAYYKIAEIVAGDRDGECEANASLIAAAPELLEALQAALEALRGSAGFDEINNAKKQVKAAIAKATGSAA